MRSELVESLRRLKVKKSPSITKERLDKLVQEKKITEDDKKYIIGDDNDFA